MKEFKYKTTFTVNADFKRVPSFGKYNSAAAYGLDELKSLLPSEEIMRENPDFLYTCFNAAVVNLINLNGDGMDTETALSVIKTFLYKPMNLEHDRESIVGFITNVGFSSFKENKLLTEEEIILTNDPFNISLAAIVWKLSDEWFTEKLGKSQEEENHEESDRTISTSWEVGFNDFYLIVGSKNFKEGEFIRDPEKIRELEKYLLSEGGKGFTPDGREIYRVISGDARFLGCAFTSNPAAAVRGVHVVDPEKIEVMKIEDSSWKTIVENKLAVCASLEDFSEKMFKDMFRKEIIAKLNEKCEKMLEKEEFLEKNITETSNNENINVYLDDMSDKETTSIASVSSLEISQDLKKSLAELNEKYLEAAKQTKQAEQEASQLKDDLCSVKASYEDLKNEFDSFRAIARQKEDQLELNFRLEALKEEFELNSNQIQAIASDIKGLNDEDFQGWKDKQSLFLSVKSTIASTKPEKEEILDELKEVKASIPNAISDDSNISSKMKKGLESGKVSIASLTR